ncbi:MAG TPA: hypothetical protein PLX06_00065 [Fimbriimonadaceae bacterium]|nr:hypothetical protein [Fimbriimonadaceae bacterium]
MSELANKPAPVLVDPTDFVLRLNRIAASALEAAITLTVAKQEEAAITRQAEELQRQAGAELPKEFADQMKVSIARARIEPMVRDMVARPQIEELRHLILFDGLAALQACAPADDRPEDIKAWISQSVESAAARQ